MKKSELFQQYYREFLPKIYRFVFFRVGGKRETAEDLTSEIFIKALDNFDSFDEAKPFSPWIYQIAKNHLINHYRVMGRTVPMDEEFDAPDKGGEERVIAFESRDELTKILNKLPPEKQRVLELKYLDGFSYKEIAEMLGEKELNLRVMVSRTLKELRKLSDFPSLIRRGKGR